MDTFTVTHISGPCSNMPFTFGHMNWSSRRRIRIVSGERIRVVCYGHGADFAEDVYGSNIHEWIFGRGNTPDYPNSGGFPKGFVTIDIRASRSHGLGNRRVIIKYLAGVEILNLEIVPNCDALIGTPYRNRRVVPVPTAPSSGIVIVRNTTPNILPYGPDRPYVPLRPIGSEIATPLGGMFMVSDYFGHDNLGNPFPDNIPTDITLPKITWGITGDNLGTVNSLVDAQLFDDSDVNNPHLLDTLTLPQGFPPNTPFVTRDNYPGRPSTVRVVNNPSFRVGSGMTTRPGTFTAPGTTPTFDPSRFLLVVDPGNLVDEGNVGEFDNSITF